MIWFKKRVEELDELKEINLRTRTILDLSEKRNEMLSKLFFELHSEFQLLNKNLSEKPVKQEDKIPVQEIKTPKNLSGELKEIIILLDYLIMNTDLISKRKYLKLKKRLNYV